MQLCRFAYNITELLYEYILIHSTPVYFLFIHMYICGVDNDIYHMIYRSDWPIYSILSVRCRRPIVAGGCSMMMLLLMMMMRGDSRCGHVLTRQLIIPTIDFTSQQRRNTVTTVLSTGGGHSLLIHRRNNCRPIHFCRHDRFHRGSDGRSWRRYGLNAGGLLLNFTATPFV